MNQLITRQQREALANTKQYQVTLTTSYETPFGVSGHLFEMIEYYYHLKYVEHFSVCLLITDGTPIDVIKNSIINKYAFTTEVIDNITNNTIYKYQPKAILANTLIIVNGSLRLRGADLLVNKTILFRCSEDDVVRDDVLVLQDYDVYDPLPNSEHYKKKMLFSKFKQYDDTNGNIAMFYLTTVCRQCDVVDIMSKYNYDYIALSNEKVDGIDTIKVPANNLWSLFDTYIYTNTAKKFDCSPRFIAECSYYNKKVIFEHDYVDIGLNTRISDISKGIDTITLKEGDAIASWI